MSTPRITNQAGKRPLYEICIQVADVSLATNKKPDGAIIAQLIKQLIAAETAPGGPYKNGRGTPDLLTNVAAGYLFAVLHISLPGVTSFINSNRAGKHNKKVGELLKKYDNALLSQKSPSQKTSVAITDTIFSIVITQLSKFDEPLRSRSLRFLQRIKQADKNFEIPLFASYFSNTLIAPPPHPPLELLGEANIYCWMAYTIYDHIIDDQSGPENISVANCAHRLALARYNSLFSPDHPFSKLVASTFDSMDAANSWELANGRFLRKQNSIIVSSLPRYNQFSVLARRSFGHALGPMALAYLCDQSSRSRHLIEKGLRHYLIAKQLTDDIYDWQEDVNNGSSSAIVTHILRHAQIRPGVYEINSLIKRMQKDFWQHSMEAGNALIKRHVRFSTNYFLESGHFLPHGPLFGLLERLEIAATRSEYMQADYKNFISAYRELP